MSANNIINKETIGNNNQLSYDRRLVVNNDDHTLGLGHIMYNTYVQSQTLVDHKKNVKQSRRSSEAQRSRLNWLQLAKHIIDIISIHIYADIGGSADKCANFPKNFGNSSH